MVVSKMPVPSRTPVQLLLWDPAATVVEHRIPALYLSVAPHGVNLPPLLGRAVLGPFPPFEVLLVLVFPEALSVRDFQA